LNDLMPSSSQQQESLKENKTLLVAEIEIDLIIVPEMIPQQHL